MTRKKRTHDELSEKWMEKKNSKCIFDANGKWGSIKLLPNEVRTEKPKKLHTYSDEEILAHMANRQSYGQKKDSTTEESEKGEKIVCGANGFLTN